MLTQFPRWARSPQLRAQTISSHFFVHTAGSAARKRQPLGPIGACRTIMQCARWALSGGDKLSGSTRWYLFQATNAVEDAS